MPTDAELQAIADGAPAKPIEVTGQTSETQKVQTPVPVSLKDDDFVELTVDGQKVLKPYREVRDGGMRQEDYTRKTQEVAARLKEVKELYDGLTAKQKELFDKEAAIDAVLGRTPKSTKEVPGDDEVVPYGTIKQHVKEIFEQQREEFNKTLQTQFQASEEQRLFGRWEEKVTDTVDNLIKEHTVLAKVPNLAGALKLIAKGDNPQNEQEMLAAVIKAGKRVAKDFDDAFDERQKQADIKRKNLRERGPEPGGGQTSFKAPEKSYVKGRKIDWDSLEKDVISTIENMEE